MKDIEVLDYIAKSIRKFRKDKALTLDDLSSLSKVHKNYLSRLENGEANISVNKLISICSALDIHISDVFPNKYSVLNIESPIENGRLITDALSKITNLSKRNPYFFNDLIKVINEFEDNRIKMLHEILNLSTKLNDSDLLIVIRLITSINCLEDKEEQ